MKKMIKFKINDYNDRNNIITALANNGYMVSVEKKKASPLSDNYYVVVEGDDNE